ncbi:bacterioferritin [bacterium]|nr:bacterioferritin [bacterium]
MKGNEGVIKKLNELLAEELTAINQYMVHSEMCENWKYEKLHKAIEKRAFKEMKHAEQLIERILFLDGRPIVSKLDAIKIGEEVEAQIKNDLKLEEGADKMYNEAIKLAAEAGDNATRDLLTEILKDEEGHIDELEGHLSQIQQMGLQNFLSAQVGEE